MAKVFTISDGLENLGALQTGGQGSVYKAKRGNIISAVKILPTPIHSEDENDKNYRDFQNEVAKLKKVNEEASPYIVKILSSGITESGSLPYIEMEFIEGPDLEDLIRPPHDTVFTISETIKVAEQLSNALAHCHKVSVKHGDIKSNNVKFDSVSGNYILLDFGLSVMSDEQRRTSLRHAGAIEFMAPEQHEGEMLVQSDVYSFGVILFELLAGQVPFPLNGKGETARNVVMVSHLDKGVPDILNLRESNMPSSWEKGKRDFEMLVPGWLLAIIARCLEKRPENRFKSGVELHKAIVDSASGKEIYTYKPIIPVLAGTAALAGTPSNISEQAAITPDSLGKISSDNENRSVFPPIPTASRTGKKNWVPGKIAIALGILLAILVLFGGYSIMKQDNPDVIDSTALKQQLIDSVLNAQRIQDSIDNANQPAPPLRSHGKGKGKSKGKGHKKK